MVEQEFFLSLRRNTASSLSLITERHKDITTMDDARNFAEVDTDDVNDIIMWQLTNPWGEDQPQHLVFHRRKFLPQNLDASTSKPVDAFVAEVAAQQKGGNSGSPMIMITDDHSWPAQRHDSDRSREADGGPAGV